MEFWFCLNKNNTDFQRQFFCWGWGSWGHGHAGLVFLTVYHMLNKLFCLQATLSPIFILSLCTHTSIQSSQQANSELPWTGWKWIFWNVFLPYQPYQPSSESLRAFCLKVFLVRFTHQNYLIRFRRETKKKPWMQTSPRAWSLAGPAPVNTKV